MLTKFREISGEYGDCVGKLLENAEIFCKILTKFKKKNGIKLIELFNKKNFEKNVRKI